MWQIPDIICMYHAYAKELQTIEVVLYKHYTNTMISIAAVRNSIGQGPQQLFWAQFALAFVSATYPSP